MFSSLPPIWLKKLPFNLRPDQSKVKKLEALRSKYSIPHDLFTMRILSSPAITRQVQENVYIQVQKEKPLASQKELLETVFMTRALLPEPHGLGMTKEEIHKEMRNINTLSELIQYFIKRDEEKPAFPDPLGIGRKIDEILES